MKKHLGELLLIALTVCFTACGNGQPAAVTENATERVSTEDTVSVDQEQEESNSALSIEETSISEEDKTDMENKSDILVVYFSRTGEQYAVGTIDEGNTSIVAKIIAEETGADTFELLPVEDNYPMTYDELCDMAKQELNEGARPEYIKDNMPDLSNYSTIFVGAPVWWGDWPMIFYTFFENEDLAGKTLYPFSTHAGSGLSGFDKKLSKILPESNVGEGLAILGEDCQNNQDGVKASVESWLLELGF